MKDTDSIIPAIGAVMNFDFSSASMCIENLKDFHEQLSVEIEELNDIIEKIQFLKAEGFEEEEAYLRKKKSDLEIQNEKMKKLYQTLEKISFVFEKTEKRNLTLPDTTSDKVSVFDIVIPEWINQMFY